jgi:type IV pilus assembly protein PilB
MHPDIATPGVNHQDLKRPSLFSDLELGQANTPQAEPDSGSEDLEASSRSTGLSPVMSLVDRILIEALTSSASDIHVEPKEDGLLFRFRHVVFLSNV